MRPARALPTVALAAGCLLLPAPAGAQEAPTLDRVEAAADSGRADSARAMLVRWFAVRSDGASPAERDRARYLRARLTADADSAASRYLRAAVDGSAAYGDRAWLRLAQLRLAEEEPERALRALERLRSDHPSTDLSAASWLWAGHAHRQAGRAAAACDAWRRALEADGDVGRRARAALEGCGADPGAAKDRVAAADTARTPGDTIGRPRVDTLATAADTAAAPADTIAAAGADTAPGRPPDGDAKSAGWVVQIGAFSDRAGAEKLRRTAGKRVPDVELVIVPPGPGDDLFRVRTRPAGDRAAARRLAEEMESRNLSAIVVRSGP